MYFYNRFNNLLNEKNTVINDDDEEEDDDKKNEKIIKEVERGDILFISLGQQCGVAYNLENFGYKEETLPFDWIRTPNFACIVNLIENNFEGFLNKENLEYNENPEIKFYFRNKINRCEFVHECEEQDFGEIEEKYTRRISRFYDKLKTYKKIIFIRDIYRHNYSKNYIDVISLNNFNRVIKSINPDLEYLFYIIYKDDILSSKVVSSIKQQIPENIVFIQDNTYGRYWKREQFNWKRLFEMGLLYFQNRQSFHNFGLEQE